MQSLRSHGLQPLLPKLLSTNLKFTRGASLTSAIGRGIRKGANTLDRLGTTRREQDKEKRSETRFTAPPRSRLEIERSERPLRPQKKRWGKEREPTVNISFEAPQGVPYTTAGSEFLYGTFAVKAALEAKRRRLHKLYVWKGENGSNDGTDESISKLARYKRIRVEEVAGTWDKMLMRMSGQRPHNGYVLEASPVPKLPITALQTMEDPSSSLTVSVLPQSSEDQLVNSIFESEGTSATVPRIGKLTRYPLLLWLDRITDTGNLGAIIRSAYFFGVDAIIIPEHGTAPLSPITVKASAGTAEYLPILTVRKELDFVKSSKERGWTFFAGVAPDSASSRKGPDQSPHDSVSDVLDTGPCVLMVGNEGEGLRGFMQRAADELINIESGRDVSGVVDSLNVSVASALLMARFVASKKSPTSSHHTPSKRLDVEVESAKEPNTGSKEKSEDLF